MSSSLVNTDEYTRVINISPKHQITIPQKFYSILNFGNEAICVLKDNEIVIRPFRASVHEDFSEEILTELISQGYSGNELLDKFKQAKADIRLAAKLMVEDAEKAADGIGEFYTEKDVFGED